MKLIIITLTLLSFNTFAGGEYMATELFTKEDVSKVVDKYYELHDTRAHVSEYLKLLADDRLYMLMGSEVTSKKSFSKWLRKMRLFSKEVSHSVESIEITEEADGSYFVDSCIRYKGKFRFGFKFDKSDTIQWKMIDSVDGSKLLIEKYVVISGC